uniref:F-box domain-containing protein n=1 Tax=Plectus sambesii TaxID=2011161 RepID=A0A914VXT5_9BILA
MASQLQRLDSTESSLETLATMDPSSASEQQPQSPNAAMYKIKMCKRKSCSDESSTSGGLKKLALSADTEVTDMLPLSPSSSKADDIEDEDDEGVNEEDVDVALPPEVAQWVELFKEMSGARRLEALSALVMVCSLPQIRHLKSTIAPYFQKDFISELPKEIAVQILSLLSPVDVAKAAAVCRRWRTISEDNKMWKEKCQEMGVPLPGRNPRRQTGSCYIRSPYKASYLRHHHVQFNWRRSPSPLSRQQVLKGHDEHVITCLQICGDIIVSGSDDNTLRVWSAARGECVHILVGHTGGVWSSQMSLDGAMVLSGSTDRTVRVWSTASGKCLHNLQGHTSTVRCLSLRDNTVVSGSRDTTLRVWDVTTGECRRVLMGHVAAIRCVQFDGERVVSGAYDYTIKVWMASTGSCVHTLAGHTNRVYSLLFESARNLVVSGSLDTSIRVWDIEKGVCQQTLIGHQSLTSGMQLRDDLLVSGNADSTIKVWNIKDGQCLQTLAGKERHQSAVTSLQFLESGMVVTSSDDGTVKLWDAVQGTFVRDLVRLESGGSGGCIWRLKATPTTLACAVGSRNGTEDTKLILLNFDADYP